MAQSPRRILACITADRNRILSAGALVLLIADESERKRCAQELRDSLDGDALQLENGDFLILSKA